MVYPDAHIHFFPDFHEISSSGESGSPVVSGDADVPLLLNSTVEEEWFAVQKESLSLRVRPFFGIHPWFTDGLREGWDVRLAEILEKNPSAGVGEIGVDAGKKYGRTLECLERQVEIFSRQLAVAADFSRPVSIHCVRAWGWIWEPMRKIFFKKNLPIIFHAFSGSPETAADILLKKRWNAFFSFAAFQARPEREKWRELLRFIPRERLLLETDAETLKEARRIDAFYRVSAEILKMPPEELREIVCRNLNRIRTAVSSF